MKKYYDDKREEFCLAPENQLQIHHLPPAVSFRDVKFPLQNEGYGLRAFGGQVD